MGAKKHNTAYVGIKSSGVFAKKAAPTKQGKMARGGCSDQYHSKPFQGLKDNDHTVHFVVRKLVVTQKLDELGAFRPEFVLRLW